MERLTEKFKDGRNILRKGIADIFHVGFGRFFDGEAVDKLAEYEDLEGQGRLLKLPCTVGDTVFEIYEGEIIERIVRGILFRGGELWGQDGNGSHFGIFGKTVFLTRPDAERALAEMEGKK